MLTRGRFAFRFWLCIWAWGREIDGRLRERCKMLLDPEIGVVLLGGGGGSPDDQLGAPVDR